jgi:hypothetical protein
MGNDVELTPLFRRNPQVRVCTAVVARDRGALETFPLFWMPFNGPFHVQDLFPEMLLCHHLVTLIQDVGPSKIGGGEMTA